MKTAKRILAVLLVFLTMCSAFSIAGSAKMNPTTTAPALWDGAGTITYGLDVYKVDGETYTKVDTGSTLLPGDVIEVRVSFGTDFITYYVRTLIFYDVRYFVPFLNGAPKTDLERYYGSYTETVFLKTYENAAPSGTLAVGGSATFFDTLSEAAGVTYGVNSYLSTEPDNDRNQYYPTYMRQGYEEGANIKNTTPVAEKYQNLGYTYAAFSAGEDSPLWGKFLASVPYATYYSFQMQVKEGANSEGALTSIFMPVLAQRTAKNDGRNKLYGGTANKGEYYGASRTMYGQGIDVTNAEFEAVIGTAAHEHFWDEGVVTEEPTAFTEGVMTYTCTVCGETRTEVIEMLPYRPLMLHTSAGDLTGNALEITVPYARRGSIATQLTADKEDVTFTSSNAKLLTVDRDGTVRFARLCIFCRYAVITAKSADGEIAAVKIYLRMNWYHYLLWMLFGSFWF